MQKASLFLIMFLLVVHAFAQEEETARVPLSDVADVKFGLIKGKVTDTQTPRPNNLADATITVNSGLIDERRVTSTDAAGSYEVSNLPPGEYVVKVEKPGYDESQDYVTVTPGGEASHDVRLYKTDTLFTLLTKPAILGFYVILPILVGIFWIWMLVDCATKESSEGNDKIVWIIIIIFTNFIGALIYFFVRRPKRKAELGR
jgi:hypothetical protein